MGLINTDEANSFNKTEIKRGFAIWAKHITWDEGKAGFVNAVSTNAIVAHFAPGINNVVNQFIITAEEAAAGEWVIRYSEDLSDIHSYPAREEV